MTSIETSELILKRLSKVQPNLKGKKVCPRCGTNHLNDDLEMEAISRYADVCICEECEKDEAIRDFEENVLSIDQWYLTRKIEH